MARLCPSDRRRSNLLLQALLLPSESERQRSIRLTPSLALDRELNVALLAVEGEGRGQLAPKVEVEKKGNGSRIPGFVSLVAADSYALEWLRSDLEFGSDGDEDGQKIEGSKSANRRKQRFNDGKLQCSSSRRLTLPTGWRQSLSSTQLTLKLGQEKRENESIRQGGFESEEVARVSC